VAIQDYDKNIQGKLMTREYFNELYTKDSNPWLQDGSGNYFQYNIDARLNLARCIRHLKGNVTEVGCGLGYALDTISYNAPGRKYTGVDISDVAINKARALFPGNKFLVADIRNEIIKNEIIILNEILWYVIHDFDKVLDNCECRYLIINHGFLKEQKFDRDIIDGWGGLLAHLLMRDYTILHANYDAGGEPFMNGLVLCQKSM